MKICQTFIRPSIGVDDIGFLPDDLDSASLHLSAFFTLASDSKEMVLISSKFDCESLIGSEIIPSLIDSN